MYVYSIESIIISEENFIKNSVIKHRACLLGFVILFVQLHLQLLNVCLKHT